MTDKENKVIVGPGDTLEVITDQINTNTSNINTQIVQTDINTTDIAELREVVGFAPGDVAVSRDEFGDLANLSTDDKSNMVNAVNEVDANSDALDVRLTTAETNIISNDDDINQLQLNQGELSILTTDNKNSLVEAINEVESNTNTNAFNISANTTNLDALTNRVTKNELDIGNVDILTTDDKNNLTNAVNEIDAHADANTNKNTQQDLRLSQLEDALAGTVSDYTIYSGPRVPGTILGSTALTVQPNIVRDFIADSNQIAIWNNVGTANQSITVSKKATIEGDLWFDVTQITGAAPTITIELYSLTNLRVLDSVVRLLDFKGSIDLTNVEGAFIADVDANEEFIIRAYLDGTNEVDVTNFAGKLKVSATVGELQQIFDYNVINTSTATGTTQLEVNNNLQNQVNNKLNLVNGVQLDPTYFNTLGQPRDVKFDAEIHGQTNLYPWAQAVQTELLRLDADKVENAEIWDSNGNVALGAKSYSAVYKSGANGQPLITNTAGLTLLRWVNGGVEFGDSTAAGPYVFTANREADFKIKGKNPLQVRDTGLWIKPLKDQTGSFTSIYDVFAGKNDVPDLGTLPTDVANNTAAIADLTDRVEANESAILSNDTDITNLQNTKADKTYVDSENAAQDTIINSNSSKLDEIYNQLAVD